MKIVTYSDGRTMVINNNYKFHKTNHTSKWNLTKERSYDGQFMTTKQFIRTIKHKFRELFSYKFTNENCLFFTLKGLQSMTWNECNNVFKSFQKQIKRNFGNFKYIKTIECNQRNERKHIHMIFMFDDGIPSKLNKKWLQQHCKYEITEKKVDNVYNLLSYMTSYYDEIKNQDQSGLTKYPKGAKFITWSRDLEKDDKKIIELNDTIEHLPDYTNKYQDLIKNNKTRIENHKYINKETGEIKLKIDITYFY